MKRRINKTTRVRAHWGRGIGFGLLVAVVSAWTAWGAQASGVKTELKQAGEKVQTKVYEWLDKDIAAVSFAEGSSSVSDAEKTSLRALITGVRNESKIKQVIVAAWSDNEVPADKQQKLSDRDRELAKKRNATVKQLLDTLGVSPVTVYNMAESPSALGAVFKTRDSNVKKAVAGSHVDDQKAEKLAVDLRAKGGPGKAVVIVQRADGTSSTN